MSSIDERIVKMTFDNSDFEGKISKTLDSLERLNETLSKTGTADGVNALNKALKEIKTQLSGMEFESKDIIDLDESESKLSKFGNALASIKDKIVDKMGGLLNGADESIDGATDSMYEFGDSTNTVSQKFSALNSLLQGMFINLGSRITDLGINMAKSLTIDPVKTGFEEYETKMNAISTILANTADKGTTLDDVNKALNELNQYADDTVYNFAQMTENIGRFTAAGVGLEDSVAAIKGLSNLAAFFGVDATKASGAMYQMSQALAAGKVQLMDWNSLVNAGMSGEAFQKALIRTSEVMGTGADAAIKKYGSFRDSLTEGAWLTSEVMVETLKQISGAYKESELRAKGYSATQAKAIVDMAKAATKSATEVRTVTGMIDAMKESIQSGWAISWEHILGDKEEATKLLTGVKDAFEALINPSIEARNNMLEFWNEAGGRDDVIAGLGNIFTSLGKGLGAIGDAWKEVFPAMTGQKLVELSEKFKNFTEKIKMNDEVAGKIKDTFKGVFNVFKTVGSAVSSVFKAFTPLTGVFSAIGNVVLSVTSGIGKLATAFSEAVAKSNVFDKMASGIKTAFETIGNVINETSKGISAFFDYLGKLDFSKAFGFIGKGFSAIGDMISPIFESIGKVIGTIDFGTIMKALQTASFLEVLKVLKNTFEEVGGVAESAKGIFSSFKGIGKGIKETLTTAKEALEAMQKDLQAKTLIKIAGAVLMLAAALIVLASIDAKSLAASLAGLGVIFAELAAAYIAIGKFGKGGVFSGVGMSAKLIAMASAMLILAGALKVLSTINVGEMMTGLVGLAALLGTMAVAVKMFGSASKGLAKTSSGLIIFGAAMMVMAGALKLLGSIDAETLGSGLFALAGVLVELAAFLSIAKFGGLSVTTATGILVLSAALVVLSQAVKQFGNLDKDQIIKGLTGIAAILVEIAAFSKLGGSGLKMLTLAAGLTGMSVAMLALSVAMKSMGNMQWDTIARGLVSMAGSLVILGTASKLMSGIQLTILAAGVAAMSAALLVLGSALKLLGTQSWSEVAISLVSLAGALTILAVAMYAMSGCLLGAAAMLVMAGALAVFVPQLLLLSQLNLTQVGIALLALAGAFTVIGAAGYLLIGALPGLLGLAAAIALFGVGAAAAGAGMALFGTGFAAVAAAIGASGVVILEFIRQLINLLPQIATKAGEAMINFAGAISKGGPQLVAAFTTVIGSILTAMATLTPQFVDTGVKMVLAFAEGLVKVLPQLVKHGMEMITGVLEGIASNIGRLVDAGAKAIVNFINGVSANLGSIISAGINLALSFIEGVANGLNSNQARLESAMRNLITAIIRAGLAVIKGAISGFVSGGKELMNGFINGVKSMVSGAGNAVKSVVDAAKRAASNLGNSLVSAGKNLVQGFVNGIKSMAASVATAAKNVVQGAVNAAKKALQIHSPSRVFIEIGKFTTEGFAVGLNKYAKVVKKPAENLANAAIDTVSDSVSRISDLINGDMDAQPVISPVMDLSNVKEGSRTIGELLANNNDLALATNTTGAISHSIGKVQNGNNNSDIVSALKDLKNSINKTNGNTYQINGITYDDGSSVVNAVETLVRAAKIERRI